MQTIYTINTPEAAHLAAIKAEMTTLGSPTIRAFWNGDAWLAIEGSHRIAAAAALGLPVIIDEVDEDDAAEGHDIQDLAADCTVGEILAYGDWTAAAYTVEVL